MWNKYIFYYFGCAFILVAAKEKCVVNGPSSCKSRTQSCTTQILDNKTDPESCTVEYFERNSEKCKTMKFNSLSSSADIGSVSLRPYLLKSTLDCSSPSSSYSTPNNVIVLNISFSNIKWKNMRFRFKPINKNEQHCRTIVLSNNATVNDKSILYYQCYWQSTLESNGQSHFFDFEATDGYNINRGTFIFNVPTPLMLGSETTEENWRPFVYIELFAKETKLHIMPPAKHLKIQKYIITLMRNNSYTGLSDEMVKEEVIKVENVTEEVIHTIDTISTSGWFYVVVTTVHENCANALTKCPIVKTPLIPNINSRSLEVCIASVITVFVACLLACYCCILWARKKWCKEYDFIDPESPKILVIYPAESAPHTKCVHSLVDYYRSEYGLNLMFDGDIHTTSHKNPQQWAYDAFQKATHIMYVVGPKDETNNFTNIAVKDNIAEVLTPHRNMDATLLRLLEAHYAKKEEKRKEVFNVFFEHSIDGPVPIETKHCKGFYLVKEWNKLHAYLSKDMHAKTQISRTEHGRNFIKNLTEAKAKLVGNEIQKKDMISKCDKKVQIEHKILLDV